MNRKGRCITCNSHKCPVLPWLPLSSGYVVLKLQPGVQPMAMYACFNLPTCILYTCTWFIVDSLAPRLISQAFIAYLPSLSPRLISQAYLPGLSPRLISQAYLPGLSPRLISQAYLPGLSPRLISQAYLPGLSPRFIYQVYLPSLSPRLTS